MRIGVTGAGGFVGGFLCRYFAQRGHSVVAFSRGPLAGGTIERRPYDLASPPDPESIADLDVVVHAAYEAAGPRRPQAERHNVEGTMALAQAVTAAGGHFVFLSSVSARPEARSVYGRHKYALERRLDGARVTIVRPGLVVGDGGLIRGLATAMRRGPIPLIDGGRLRVYVVGLEDLGSAIEVCIERRIAGRVTAIAAAPVTLRELAASLARRCGILLRAVNVPWPVAFAAAWLAERAGITLPLTTENLWGMRIHADERPDLGEFGWRARSWDELLPGLAVAAT